LPRLILPPEEEEFSEATTLEIRFMGFKMVRKITIPYLHGIFTT
jgi:hypothetical protein